MIWRKTCLDSYIDKGGRQWILDIRGKRAERERERERNRERGCVCVCVR